jgi:hypothetical protein
MILKEVQFVTIEGRHYILSNDSMNQLFVFSINDQLVVANFDELLGEQIQWAQPVLVEPEFIGFVNEGEVNGLFKINHLSDEHLEKIKNNGGICKIEVNPINMGIIDDPTFLPHLAKTQTPIFHDSKVIIHI